MEYDQKYGASAIAVAPFNLLTLPFQWITFLPNNSDEFLIWFNLFLCKILYFPVAVTISIMFTIMNILILPFAYMTHTSTLVNTLFNSDETMDDWAEKFKRIFTIFKFVVLGPVILIQAVPVDTYVFWINLFSKSNETIS